MMTSEEAVVYALTRMPVTYCTVKKILSVLLKTNKAQVKSLLDVGAGTGAATWAALDTFGDMDVVCIEKETAMLRLGKRLLDKNKFCNTEIKWIQNDFLKLTETDISADLVIASYVMNEINDASREKAVEKIWNMTKKFMVIIEPGTMKGHANICAARAHVLKTGGYIIAPCTHRKKYMFPEPDWRHSSYRAERSKAYRLVKNTDGSFGNEKFSYIIFSKKASNLAPIRILKHPYIEKGFIQIRVCTTDGIHAQ